MTLTVSAEAVVFFTLVTIAVGWFIAWRQGVKREREEKRREQRRRARAVEDREIYQLLEEARRDPDFTRIAPLEPLPPIDLHRELPIEQARLTEEQRQRVRQAMERATRNMGRFNRHIDAGLRQTFQSLNETMREVGRRVEEAAGQQSWTTAVTTESNDPRTQADRAKAAQPPAKPPEKKPEPAEIPNRFERILRNDD